ncbi:MULTISPECIES: DUF58 domain-containing protein [Paenibacillus]|uniref:DUF58 domain-containing protein n=1 Tax=Paenibacillus TaxID=44249 RepID=UPI0022B8C080|nr:DUF58 domain-containing protein [Paenibacillus caseinilyticus]MCZ8524102.1 DUF58 domain-containing protein [Paenibacillus caseinilyticus]
MSLHGVLLIAAAAAAGQSLLFRRLNFRRLTYERHWSTRTCYPGEEIELVERIENRKPFPVPWLRLESLLHGSLQFRRQFNLHVSGGEHYQNHRSFFSLMPFTRIVRRHKVVPLQRGCYRLSTASLTAGDILGLLQTTCRQELGAELLVYPAPLPAGALQRPGHHFQGDLTVRRWMIDDPFLTAGTREYQAGDALRRVNWMASARTGNLQVHRHEYTAERRLMVYLNVEDHEGMWQQVNRPQLIEWGISASAELLTQAISQGMEAGFGTNAGSVDAPDAPTRTGLLSGSAQGEALLDTLARLVLALGLPIETFLDEEADRLQGGPRLDILLVTAFVSGKMEEPLDRLRSQGHTVDILHIPTEEEMKL